MLEAFQSLRDKLTAKKQVEVDQTSASAPKPAVNLDLPPPSQPQAASNLEQMEWTMVLHFHLISVLIII